MSISAPARGRRRSTSAARAGIARSAASATVAFASRFIETHLEGRTHHETLELGFHDTIRAAGACQAQIVAVLCRQLEGFTLKNFFDIARYFEDMQNSRR